MLPHRHDMSDRALSADKVVAAGDEPQEARRVRGNKRVGAATAFPAWKETNLAGSFKTCHATTFVVSILHQNRRWM